MVASVAGLGDRDREGNTKGEEDDLCRIFVRFRLGLVEDAVTFPILTKEVNSYGRGSRNGNMPGGGGGSLTRTAQGAMHDLLGWRYRADDPKGFLAALNKAVDLKEVEGHIESTWKSQPFTVQADLGEVTGAQASVYERATVALEQALPLLTC